MSTSVKRLATTMTMTAAVMVTAATAVVPPAGTAVAVPTVAMANGCGGEDATAAIPDSSGRVSFTPACNAHDDCYSPASTTDRAACDQKLRDDMHAACFAEYGPYEENPPGPSQSYSPGNACHDQAELYYDGVRAVGDSYYQGRGDPR